MHSAAVEGHNCNSFVVAVGEHERSRHMGRQDSIVLAFLGKVNQGSNLRRGPQIQTFQESLEGLHSRKISSNHLLCGTMTLFFGFERRKCMGNGKWLSRLRDRKAGCMQMNVTI